MHFSAFSTNAPAVQSDRKPETLPHSRLLSHTKPPSRSVAYAPLSAAAADKAATHTPLAFHPTAKATLPIQSRWQLRHAKRPITHAEPSGQSTGFTRLSPYECKFLETQTRNCTDKALEYAGHQYRYTEKSPWLISAAAIATQGFLRTCSLQMCHLRLWLTPPNLRLSAGPFVAVR